MRTYKVLHAETPQILDPAINTLPYLYVLLAHISAGKQKSPNVGGPLWLKATAFLERFDPVQVRYVGTEFRRLITSVRDAALAGNKVRVKTAWSDVALTEIQLTAAVRPIRSAILRLDPSSSCFTSTHLHFVRLCLQASTFQAAKPVLDKDIYEFPTSSKAQTSGQLPCSQHDTSSGFITDQTELSAHVSYRDVLQYLICAAMISMALKEWSRAIVFLESILTAPTKNHTSQIQVEAYKKWVIANLLAHGEVVSILNNKCSSRMAFWLI